MCVVPVCHRALPSAGWHGSEPGVPSPGRAMRLHPPPCSSAHVSLVIPEWAKGAVESQTARAPGLQAPWLSLHGQLPAQPAARQRHGIAGARAAALGRPPRRLCAGANADGAGGRWGWRSSGEHPREVWGRGVILPSAGMGLWPGCPPACCGRDSTYLFCHRAFQRGHRFSVKSCFKALSSHQAPEAERPPDSHLTSPLPGAVPSARENQALGAAGRAAL